jgi:hypothetical protein
LDSIVSLHPNSPSSSPSSPVEHSGASRSRCCQIPQSSHPHPSSYPSSIFVILYSFVITLVVDCLPPPWQPVVFVVVSICGSCSHSTLVSPPLNQEVHREPIPCQSNDMLDNGNVYGWATTNISGLGNKSLSLIQVLPLLSLSFLFATCSATTCMWEKKVVAIFRLLSLAYSLTLSKSRRAALKACR